LIIIGKDFFSPLLGKEPLSKWIEKELHSGTGYKPRYKSIQTFMDAFLAWMDNRQREEDSPVTTNSLRYILFSHHLLLFQVSTWWLKELDVNKSFFSFLFKLITGKLKHRDPNKSFITVVREWFHDRPQNQKIKEKIVTLLSGSKNHLAALSAQLSQANLDTGDLVSGFWTSIARC